MSDTCIVRMENIWTCFGDEVVHRDLNLCLTAGERLGLVGGSGSGKTTLMREMIGLQQPTRGKVYIQGQALNDLDQTQQQQLRNQCGVLFQQGALFTDLNVFDNIAFPLREMRVLDESLIRELVCMKLRMVGLDERVAELRPSELSGGMIKRVGLARALILEPELLFLDEPGSGLDPVSSDTFVSLLQRLHRDLGFTMVMVTHDLHTLRDLCDRVAVLAEGQFVADGPLDEVLRCDHPYVREFFKGERGRRVLELEEV